MDDLSSDDTDDLAKEAATTMMTCLHRKLRISGGEEVDRGGRRWMLGGSGMLTVGRAGGAASLCQLQLHR